MAYNTDENSIGKFQEQDGQESILLLKVFFLGKVFFGLCDNSAWGMFETLWMSLLGSVLKNLLQQIVATMCSARLVNDETFQSPARDTEKCCKPFFILYW